MNENMNFMKSIRDSNSKISPALFASVDYQIFKLISEFNQEYNSSSFYKFPNKIKYLKDGTFPNCLKEFKDLKEMKEDDFKNWIANYKNQFEFLSKSPNKLKFLFSLKKSSSILNDCNLLIV